MREINKIAEGLFEKIRDRFEDVSLGDDKAKATTDPESARFFNFDYVVDDVNHGNITISLIDETSLKVYFSKNISDDLEDEHKKEWYRFLRELREFAKRNLLSFEPRDITRSTLKHRDLQQISRSDDTYTKDDVVSESLYGTRRSSYEKKGPVRIIVRHSQPILDEENRRARSHHINNIYVENQEGERFKMPVKSLKLARAVAQHFKQGGDLHDDLGRHICEMAVEAAKLKPFLNKVRHRTFEDTQTHAMVEAAFEYHGLLNNTLTRMTGKKGYKKCKEQFVATSTSYIPEVDTDEMKERFVKRTFDERLEEALPLVHKAYNMKKENKFAEQFESWADTVSEGTWAVPDSDDEVGKLIDVLNQPLPVGVDAQNATNALYDIIGDDRLFDRLGELAKSDPEADARDLVVDWLQDNLPQIYQQIMNEIGDADVPAEQGQEDEQEINEGTAGQHLSDATAKAIISTNIDLYNARSGYVKLPPGEQELLQAMYDEIVIDTGLHPDDDFEKIDQRIYDQIEADYSHVDEGNTYGSGDGGMDGQVIEDDDSQEDQLANIESIQSAIIRRILNSIDDHSELLKKAGPEGIMNAASDVASFHAPMQEIGSSDVSIMVREVYREVGVDYPEDELEEAMNPDAKIVYKLFGKIAKHEDEGYEMLDSCPVWTQLWEATDGDVKVMLAKATPQQLAAMKNELTEVVQELVDIFEAKDKVIYDPKTGKLTGWEHEGDWKKQTKKKDPVGKIHHMSDVARRRTEKMTSDETLEEAFERLVNEGAINVGDIIHNKTDPEIQGRVIRIDPDKYIIDVEGDQYHIEKLKAEKVAKEAIEMPDNPDYSGYDKPTFQRKGITPGQPNKTLPGMNDKKKPGWVGVDTTKPAYQRQADYDQEREQMKKLAGMK